MWRLSFEVILKVMYKRKRAKLLETKLVLVRQEMRIKAARDAEEEERV